MSIVNPTCPTDCTYTLQIVDADICNPDLAFGQINTIYLAARNAADLTDWTDQTEWDARLSNTGTDADDIRYLFGIGEKPAAESAEYKISKGRTIYGKRTHTITFEVEDTGVNNYNFIRYLQCNGFYKLWYQHDKWLYGGNDGIEDVSIKVDEVIPQSDEEFLKFIFTITWKAKFSPERTELNPVA